MRTAAVVTIIVIVVIVFLLIVAAARERREREGDRRSHDHRGQLLDLDGFLGSRSGNCSSPGDRPHPPREVCCNSEDRFSVSVNWKASASKELDHYVIYVKYLDHCDTHDAAIIAAPQAGRHSVGCGCRKCKSESSSSSSSCSSSSSSSSSCSPSPARCECGPQNYDRIVRVAGCDDQVVIRDIKKKAVCVTVAAVSRCGRESETGNCCTTCIDCSCRIYPCIVENDCRGISLKWDRVECADCIKIYYDGVLMYELPGDAHGVKSLPPIADPEHHITVTTENECGESSPYAISSICPCKGDCGDCQKCKAKPKRKCYKCQRDSETCGCKPPRRHNGSSHSTSH